MNSMTTDVYSAFHTCLKDKLDYIGINKTLDPKLLEWLETQRQLAAATAAALAAETSPNGTAQSNETVTVENVPMAQEQFAEFKARLPPYTGMPHPPPASNNSECDGKPWSAPFLSTYGGPLHPLNSSGNLELTQCNYYLPAGPAVAGIHRYTPARQATDSLAAAPAAGATPAQAMKCRGPVQAVFGLFPRACKPVVIAMTPRTTICADLFAICNLDCRFLWQIQYLVSQGFYVVLDFNSQRGWEPNMIFGQLLGRNWGNLWRMLTELPEYKEHLAGRVFPDLANEPRCGQERLVCLKHRTCRHSGGDAPGHSRHGSAVKQLQATLLVLGLQLSRQCCARVFVAVCCSRWNCQWESASYWRDEWTEDGVEKEKWCPRCAPIIQSFGMAAATIWRHDPHVPVMVNGLGQNRDPRKDTSGGNYESM